ncbi:hypothetical protein EI555_017073, partial [Monodon monoceros]
IPTANLDAADLLTDKMKMKTLIEPTSKLKEGGMMTLFSKTVQKVWMIRRRKRFVNDTLQSEFHKKFMEKYIK